MKVKVISYHIFSRFCMFCALLGQDIRWAFTGPLVLWLFKTDLSIKSKHFYAGVVQVEYIVVLFC